MVPSLFAEERTKLVECSLGFIIYGVLLFCLLTFTPLLFKDRYCTVDFINISRKGNKVHYDSLKLFLK